MHKLSHYLADQARREQDDRDLTSRSDLRKERKQTEEAYADLARTLCDCTNKQFGRLGLQGSLLDVALEARRIESPSAKARALRLVRRELRNIDADVIRRQLDAILHPVSKVSPQQIEGWTKRFLSEGDVAIEEFIATCTAADRQQLRGLVRNIVGATDASRTLATAALAKRITQWLNEPLVASEDP